MNSSADRSPFLPDGDKISPIYQLEERTAHGRSERCIGKSLLLGDLCL